MDRRKFSTFYLDRFWFGIEVERVQEVIPYQEITRVPLAPAIVRGLINVRGQIVTALDLRQRFGLPERPAKQLPMNLIARGGDEAVSLLVDDIGDLVEVDDSTFELPPSTLKGPARNLICGAYKSGDELLLVLDSEKALTLNQSETARKSTH